MINSAVNSDKVVEYMQNSQDLVPLKKSNSEENNNEKWKKFTTSPKRSNEAYIDTSPSRGLTDSQKDRFFKSMFG